MKGPLTTTVGHSSLPPSRQRLNLPSLREGLRAGTHHPGAPAGPGDPTSSPPREKIEMRGPLITTTGDPTR